MSLNSFQYRGEADYERMRQLLIEIYAVGGPPEYCTIGDLDWWRSINNNPEAIWQTRLWQNEEGKLVGIARPDKNEVEMMVHPRYAGLEDELLTWAEQWRREQPIPDAATAEPPTLTLETWAFDNDRKRVSILKERGYTFEDYFFTYRNRSVEGELPVAELAEGYIIRNVEGEQDLEQRVAVHRDAFAPSKMTVAKHRAVMSSPTYRSDLDLIVVAPDGTFAAFCIIWYDEANKLGEFEPVGCHSNHLRKGLTSALMYEGMRRLQALGAKTASVLALGGKDASNGLYVSLGFQEIDRVYLWKKPL